MNLFEYIKISIIIVIANILICSGVDHVITMDLHSSVMQGFFNVPVDNLFSEPTIAKYIMENISDYTNGIVVSKNAGGAMRVTSLADQLNLPFAMIEKKTNTKATIIGDVKGKICFIMVIKYKQNIFVYIILIIVIFFKEYKFICITILIIFFYYII